MKEITSEKIFLTIVSLFAVIGVLFVSIVLHEYTHTLEFRSLNYTDGEVCLFNMGHITKDSAIGYFKFKYSANDTATYEQLDKYSELKAYVVTVIIVFIGIYAILHYLMLWRLNKDRERLEQK